MISRSGEQRVKVVPWSSSVDRSRRDASRLTSIPQSLKKRDRYILTSLSQWSFSGTIEHLPITPRMQSTQGNYWFNSQKSKISYLIYTISTLETSTEHSFDKFPWGLHCTTSEESDTENTKAEKILDFCCMAKKYSSPFSLVASYLSDRKPIFIIE